MSDTRNRKPSSPGVQKYATSKSRKNRSSSKSTIDPETLISSDCKVSNKRKRNEAESTIADSVVEKNNGKQTTASSKKIKLPETQKANDVSKRSPRRRNGKEIESQTEIEVTKRKKEQLQGDNPKSKVHKAASCKQTGKGTSVTNFTSTTEQKAIEIATDNVPDIFSPRRSSRGLKPNRKFQDMETSFRKTSKTKSPEISKKEVGNVKKVQTKKTVEKAADLTKNKEISASLLLTTNTENSDTGRSHIDSKQSSSHSKQLLSSAKTISKHSSSCEAKTKANITTCLEKKTFGKAVIEKTMIHDTNMSIEDSKSTKVSDVKKTSVKEDIVNSKKTMFAEKIPKSNVAETTSTDSVKNNLKTPFKWQLDVDSTISDNHNAATDTHSAKTVDKTKEAELQQQINLEPPRHKFHSVSVLKGRKTTEFIVYPSNKAPISPIKQAGVTNSTSITSSRSATETQSTTTQSKSTIGSTSNMSTAALTNTINTEERDIDDRDDRDTNYMYNTNNLNACEEKSVSKLKTALLNEVENESFSGDRKDVTGTLIKESLALLDTSEEESVIVDTPVCVTPKTTSDVSSRRPGKIVKYTDVTICVSVTGKPNESNDNMRNVMVKIPSSCSPMIKLSTPPLNITPTKLRKIIYSKNSPPKLQMHTHVPSSPEKSTITTETKVESTEIENSEVVTDLSTIVSSKKDNSTIIGSTPTDIDKVLDMVQDLEDKEINTSQVVRVTDGNVMKEYQVIKMEPKDCNLVSAETQTPITVPENRYKKVIREVGSNRLLDDDESLDIPTEEVIMVELPQGVEVKREMVYEEKPEPSEFVTVDENGLYMCKYCTYATYKKQNWYKHKSKHIAMRTHRCPHCTYRAATSSNLKRHLAIHSDTRAFHCDICQLNFRQKIHLERHLKYKHQEKTIQCPLCTYVCANENPDLKVHIRRRHMPSESLNAHTCDECGLVTVSKKDLRQHMKFHRKGPELKLFCEHCSFVTDCESRLRRHLFIHTKEKPFQCGLCEYRGSQKEHVLRHMKSQHNIEIERNHRKITTPVVEDLSQEVVISNSNEKADYSSEEKIFACNHCTMKFSKLINLYKHLHTQHKGVMPNSEEEFTCVVCDFRTNNKKNLLVHMRKHNTQDQSPPSHVYSCVLCRYLNPRRRNLFQHMKKKHHIEIVMKDDGTANCFMADATVARGIDADHQLLTVGDMVSTASHHSDIEIITDGDSSLNLTNVISLEDIAMVVSNPLSHAVNTDPISINSNMSATSTITSFSEHEAAEAIEGLQALAEQAGLVETMVDNVIEEPVHDIPLMNDNELFIDEGETKSEEISAESAQSIQLSQEQLLNLSSGDYVEINGEMYKVEISSEEKNTVREIDVLQTE